MSSSRNWPEWIRRRKEELGLASVEDLLAMSRQRDPFYVGGEAREAQGKWFAALWKNLGLENVKSHLRRIHYRLDWGPKKLSGMPYRLTAKDWNELTESSAVARILGYVAPEMIEDHRNGEPTVPAGALDPSDPSPSLGTFEHALSPNVPRLALAFDPQQWQLAQAPFALGYLPDFFADHAYHLELWIEKTTMDDILLPLCKELGVVHIPSAGYQSIANSVKLVRERIDKVTPKPVRIFYISDFDLQGKSMPVAVARHIEYWLDYYQVDADVKLTQIALTQAQVEEYKLPAADENGKVELDALEGRRPGQLERIVRNAVEPYLDSTIYRRLREASRNAKLQVEIEWSSLMAPHQRELKSLQKNAARVLRPFEKEVAKLNGRIAAAMKPIQKQLASLRDRVENDSCTFDPDLPERPQPDLCDDEEDFLFDSLRDYESQIAAYKTFQGKR